MTKEEVKEYIDNYISHIISMTEYGNWFASEVKGLVDDAKDKCDEILNYHKCATTKKVCNVCKSEIDEILSDLENDIASLVQKEIDKLTDDEKSWLEENVAEPLGISLIFPDKAVDLLLLIPIATAGAVGAYGTTISERLRNIYEQEITTSYVSGASFEDLEENFVPRFNSFDRGLQSDSNTLGESLSSQYDRIVFTKNAKKIKGYVWSAILDSHTCLVCGELDGHKFDDISKVPMYPVHTNCRCTLLPYTEDIEDVIPESYSEWFESQPKSEKYKILGKTRFQLYENGMKIKNFVNNGKVTPLKDLKKK